MEDSCFSSQANVSTEVQPAEEDFFFFFKFTYLFREREWGRGRKRGERERDSERAGKGQKERERERIPSRLHAVSMEPDVGLEPMNCEIMT